MKSKEERAPVNMRSASRMYFCKGDFIYFYNALYNPTFRPGEPRFYKKKMTPELIQFLDKKRYYTFRKREYHEHIIYFKEFKNINRWILGLDDELHLPNPSNDAINIEIHGEIPGFKYTPEFKYTEL